MMEYIVVFERLTERIGMPLAAMLIIAWGIWQMLKPIIANINKSTETLTNMCTMLSEHNQRAVDMHATCREHSEYLCDAKDILNTNRETIMLKLEGIHNDVKNMRT